jgi:hypothetical protein
MTQTDDSDSAPAVPHQPDEDATDPDKEAGPTPTDDAAAPHNADLNVGALSQSSDPSEP